MVDSVELENFKILKSIWKNTYDKILEIKITNRKTWIETKKNILEDEKKKIDLKYQKLYNEEYISNKIMISDARNKSNMNKLEKRHQLLDQLIDNSLEKIKSFAKPDNHEYIKLIKSLIVQGMIKLLESNCLVRVRANDMDKVRNILSECENEYSVYLKEESGMDYICKLEIDQIPLENQYGGVILMTGDRKIQVINDLESRLKLQFEQDIPTIKSMLFPKIK